MQTKIVKWGNSLGLRIPRPFAREIRVAEGSIVEMQAKDGQLIIHLLPAPEYELNILLEGITDQNLHREVGTGEAVGDEAW